MPIADYKIKIPAEDAFLHGYGSAKWPIACYAPLHKPFNVNSKHGGGAALVQNSNNYGGKGPETTCQLFLLRSGFDGNNFSVSSIDNCNEGHFGVRNHFKTNEQGDLVPDCMFGTNRVALLSNDASTTNLGHGRFLEGPEDGATVMNFPLNVNGTDGSGCTLILCGGWEAGASEAKYCSALYMIRSGFKENAYQAKLVKGEDKWKFSCDDSGVLQCTGLGRSTFSLFHNRDNLIKPTEVKVSKTYFTQAVRGIDVTHLCKLTCHKQGVLLVLCSSSNGTDQATAAAAYMIQLPSGEQDMVVTLLKVDHGVPFKAESEDLWKFQVVDDNLMVTGPDSPCKYASLSNLLEDEATPEKRCNQNFCLITGATEPIRGGVEITEDGVRGTVSVPCDIVIKLDEKEVHRVMGSTLGQEKTQVFFNRDWSDSQKTTGLHLVRVFAVIQKDSSEELLELKGSPKQLIYQPPGVIYALNCCGPAYQALNNIVFTSEHTQFASFTYDFTFGSRCTALGDVKTGAAVPQILAQTLDGFLHVTLRSSGVEPEDEQKVTYNIDDLPNGDFVLRVYGIGEGFQYVSCNSKDIKGEIVKQFKAQGQTIEGCSARYAEVPITIQNGKMSLHLGGMVSGFCVIDITKFKEKEKTAEENTVEVEMKQKLSNEVQALSRTMTQKERKILGWSPNLLHNGSGEAGSMSHWSVGGQWEVREGGYQTEKSFATSHMRCTKYQEVDLTEHFSAEYLDTSPVIKVSEWYREGSCGGGFYKFEAKLLDKDGKTVTCLSTPEIGTIYKQNAWQQAEHIFNGYGAGVRRVTIESMGKDDKFWGGFFGTIISNGIVRVKQEVKKPSDDVFEDVYKADDEDFKVRTAEREKLVNQILADNQVLLQEDIVPKVDPNFQKQTEVHIKPTVKRKQKKREIWVFVSSTFRDFKEEREELIKKTFREINNMCVSRGVFFTYVDLRWGITEEQTTYGQTIAICLQEIERCRPYFLCIMGERFGWCQAKDKPDDTLNASFDYAIQAHPKTLGWLDEFRYDTSVTQLEIMHGVLKDISARKERSFFYIREPVQKESCQDDKDFKAKSPESDWHKEKQHSLRRRIQTEEQLKVKNYTKPLDVCEMIKTDLSWCIDEDFPLGTELTALERERESHTAFADARRRIYIGREEYFTEINEFMTKDQESPLVILGESGSGKSALVANWSGRYEDANSQSFVFIHFIGSSAESASYTKLLRRLFEEMKQHFGFAMAVPAEDSDLIRDFPTWLTVAGSHGKCVIVFDALNQLDDGSGADGSEHDLNWIPKQLPKGVNMLLSTLPGRAFDAVKSNNWTSMRVKPLDPTEKKDIVTGYLEGIYGKTLSDDQKSMIVAAPQTNNPLYLKALLDEVRMYGSFRLLTDKIKEYLTAANPGDLFAKILERLEQDFESGQHITPGLVRQTTTAIWCSQRGMAESELTELLQVPNAVWSPFYLSLIENLVNRNGILNFFHDHLRQAVEIKYLPTAEEKKKGYLLLADFFSNRDLDDRAVEELPFVLAKAEQLDRLKETVSNLDIFQRIVKNPDGKYDLIHYWTMLGDFKQVEPAYKEQLEKIPEGKYSAEDHSKLLQNLAEFFMELGLFDAARSMFERVLTSLDNRYKDSHNTIVYNPFNQSWKNRCHHPAVLDVLQNLGTVCEKQKDYGEAYNYYKEAIERLNRVETPAQKLQLTECLLGQGTVLYLKTDMIEAKKYLMRSREIATEVLGSRHHYVSAIINKLGQLSYKQGRLDEALTYFMQDLKLSRGELGTYHPRIAGILNDIALVYDDNNDALAGKLLEASLLILLDTYGPSHLDIAISRYNLAAFYSAKDHKLKAKYQFSEALKVFEAFLGPSHPDTQKAKEDLAGVSE